MRDRRLLWAALVTVSLATSIASATGDASPPSASFDALPMDLLATVAIGPLDVEAIPISEGHGARRVALAVPLDIDVAGAATWESVPSGGAIARLRVQSADALFLSFKFSTFTLASGVEVYFVSEHQQYAAGPFGVADTKETGRFGSPVVPGESAVIEVFVPDAIPAPFALNLESASHGFANALGMTSIPDRAPGASTGTSAFGGPFACQRDINCPEGAPYQLEKQAFAEGYDGEFICTGQLLNNTAQDGRNLYLTAAHCEFFLDPSTLSFYWNYENSTCTSSDAPLVFTTGATDLYHSIWPFGDLQLFELDGGDLESSFDVTYLGWRRDGVAPTQSATLGFPADKPLQIMIDDDPAIDCAAGCGLDSFGTDFWRIDDWEVGLTEGGSSGGALLDQDHRVVGVLTGGVGATCGSFEWDEFFKLSAEWPALAPHLDPLGTGALTVDAWDGSSMLTSFVRGDVNADGNLDVADVIATLDALFGGIPTVDCDDAGDVNDDGSVDISDPISALTHLFSGGPPPPSPYPLCGSDSTGDGLACTWFPSCP
ncbi:MAG: dockerin type I repeat-containing protein [Planctomycetes bacterium]|nr:dockerin type I repeat-containing protein [Planctomycetota bacterium]